MNGTRLDTKLVWLRRTRAYGFAMDFIFIVCLALAVFLDGVGSAFVFVGAAMQRGGAFLENWMERNRRV